MICKFNQNSYSIFNIWDVYTNLISTQTYTLFEEVCAFVTPKEFACTICVPKSYLHQYDNITPGSSLKLTSPEHSQRAFLRAFLTLIKAPTPKLLLPKDVPWDIPRYRHDLQDLQLHPQGSDVGCFPSELASVAYGRRRPTRNPSTKQRIKYAPDISW